MYTSEFLFIRIIRQLLLPRDSESAQQKICNFLYILNIKKREQS